MKEESCDASYGVLLVGVETPLHKGLETRNIALSLSSWVIHVRTLLVGHAFLVVRMKRRCTMHATMHDIVKGNKSILAAVLFVGTRV